MRLILLVLLCAPAQAERVTLSKTQVLRVEASSTSDAKFEGRRAFRPASVFDGRDWSPWGSSPQDAKGAWLRFSFDTVHYLDELELVPGNARDKGAFDRCGRPARVQVEMGGVKRVVDLRDRRYQQLIALDPPMSGARLQLTILQTHGRSTEGGVCVSEVKLRGPQDPLAAMPGLAGEIARAVGELADDGLAHRGRKALLAIGPPAMDALREALAPHNPNLASRAAEVLGHMGDRRALPSLARSAEQPDRQVRHAALWALGALRSTQHYDVLRGWYEESHGATRNRAFDALARSGDARVIDVVIAELVDGAELRRESAEAHIGNFGEEAVAALEPLLHSQVPRERAAALRALGTVDHPEAQRLLMEGFADADAEIRAAAVVGLARRGGPEARMHVAARWTSRYVNERRAVAEALGDFGDPRDFETLEFLCEDGAMSVRRVAATSLGRMGPRAKPLLRKLALRGGDGATAAAAAKGLLKGGPEAAVELLASIHAEVREVASEALLELGSTGHFALIDAVVGKSDRLRGAASTRLRKLGPSILPALLERAGGAPEAAFPEILDLLAYFEDPVAVPFASRLVREATDLTVRVTAIRVLEKTGKGAGTQPVLEDALTDKAPEVRLAAVRAIGTLKLTMMSARLMSLIDAPDPTTRRAAIRALGALREAQAYEHLVALYQQDKARKRESDPALRQDLVLAIAKIGGRKSMPFLVNAMGDPDLQVRLTAQRELK